MTLAFASYPGGDLSAIRVREIDASSIEQQLMPLVIDGVSDPQQTPVTVADKQVIKVTDGPDSPGASAIYFYAHGDVLWVLSAAIEPDLTEIVQSLP